MRCATVLLKVPFWNGGAGVAVQDTLVISTVEEPAIRSPLASTVSDQGPELWRIRMVTTIGAAATTGETSGLAEGNDTEVGETEISRRGPGWAQASDGATQSPTNVAITGRRITARSACRGAWSSTYPSDASTGCGSRTAASRCAALTRSSSRRSP